MLRIKIFKKIILSLLIVSITHILLAETSGMGSVVTGDANVPTSIIKGDGNIISNFRNELDASFSAIDSDGVFELNVLNNNNFSVEIRTDKNIMPYINTEIKNNTLIIRSTKNVSTNYGIKVSISTPNVDKITIAGSSALAMNGFNKLTKFSLKITGSSEAKLSGVVEEFIALVIGASELDAEDFKTKKTTITLKGSSEGIVWVSRQLDATLDGAGDLLVHGNPKTISKKVRGVGEIVYE